MAFLKSFRNPAIPGVLLIAIMVGSIISCEEQEVQVDKTTIWIGVVEDEDNGPVRTELSVSSGRYSLHYGVPRSCSLKGEEVSTDANEIILRFKESSGGFCKKLFQGKMTIDIGDQYKWFARVENKTANFTEGFALEKKP